MTVSAITTTTTTTTMSAHHHHNRDYNSPVSSRPSSRQRLHEFDDYLSKKTFIESELQ